MYNLFNYVKSEKESRERGLKAFRHDSLKVIHNFSRKRHTLVTIRR